MDDVLGPSQVDLSSPRGYQYVGITELEIMKVRVHRDGTITGGVQRARAIGPQAKHVGHILPLLLFEIVVGEVGWLRFKPRRPWVSEELTAVTLAPILWIDAQPLPY
ncbi:hypothetical protein RCH23_002108 [Cryobacterium sp. CAN_C3]|uniref:hypothetical protein n=1 Tax=unclassified Cryobacterium TaxID=2649013 RepID=UPI0018CAD540|nr:hypothetical protein [Cryobacterium sp. CAN_C3]MEC5154723.1 hypothetical protein [Cryobacterium sp. CAN_C3]